MDSNRAFRGAVAAVIAAAVLNGTAEAAHALTGSDATADAITGTAEPGETRTGPADTARANTDPTRTATAATVPAEASGPAIGARPASTTTRFQTGQPIWTRAGLAGMIGGITGATGATVIPKMGTTAKAGVTSKAKAAGKASYRVHRRVWRTSARPHVRVWAARTPKGRNKAIAYRLVTRRSWPVTQFRCLDSLWTRESNWNHRAQNPSSGAYGIPQALPGTKMVGVGHDWRVNPATQIRWGLKYIKGRYGSPCGAWGHFQSHNWY
ncbi:hypothetical protein GCM10022226_17650 [Sphaerisporangium flaviroseum]|uniref:Lytic transglycosylase domain-containing protein n=1 Tax=Sphaerisporangium flaviroseum TaxID=509199 RepID=A0ABP7HQ78_9ACTN